MSLQPLKNESRTRKSGLKSTSSITYNYSFEGRDSEDLPMLRGLSILKRKTFQKIENSQFIFFLANKTEESKAGKLKARS